jgi:hypothetical protein
MRWQESRISSGDDRMTKRAGLPLSVGQASITMRMLLAGIIAAAAAICIGGGMLISSHAAARVVAVLLIVPAGLIGIAGVAFVLAPHSRYGDWLDRFVPRLAERRIALLTAMSLWLAALVVTWIR